MRDGIGILIVYQGKPTSRTRTAQPSQLRSDDKSVQHNLCQFLQAGARPSVTVAPVRPISPSMLRSKPVSPHLKPPEEWMQRVGAFTGLPGLVRELGGEPVSILAQAGLSVDALRDPDDRVPYAAIGQVLREAALRTRCPHLGLLVGRMWSLSDVGLTGEVVLNSRTVGEGLRAHVGLPADEQRGCARVPAGAGRHGRPGLRGLPPARQGDEPAARRRRRRDLQLHALAVRPRVAAHRGPAARIPSRPTSRRIGSCSR